MCCRAGWRWEKPSKHAEKDFYKENRIPFCYKGIRTGKILADRNETGHVEFKGSD